MSPQSSKGQEEGPRDLLASQITAVPSNPCKVRECLVLEAISVHMESKRVVRTGQQGFTEGKSCLTNLVAFCDESTCFDEGRNSGWCLP